MSLYTLLNPPTWKILDFYPLSNFCLALTLLTFKVIFGSLQPIYTVEEEQERGARLHFIKFETKYIESCIDFIQKNLLQHGSEIEDKTIKATGELCILILMILSLYF